MTRQSFAAILDTTPCEGTPTGFALKALRRVYPDFRGKDVREIASALTLDHKWRSFDIPQRSAFWWEPHTGNCGFVWQRVVNGSDTFVAIDNTGRGHRLTSAGKQMVALPPGT